MPIEEPRREPAYIQKHRNVRHETRERQRDQNDIEIIRALHRISDQLAADEEEEKSDHKKKARREVATIVLLVLTVVAAGLGDWFFYGQLNEMGKVYDPISAQAAAARVSADATLASQRAWIGGFDANINGPLDLDGVTYQKVAASKTFSVSLQYRNSGREPSRDTLLTDPIVKIYSGVEWGNGTGPYGREVTEIQKRCSSVPHIGGSIVFPTEQPSSAWTNIFTAPTPPRVGTILPQDVVDGSAVIVFLYCIRYYTSGAQHHTAFGYFYQGGRVAPDHLGIIQVGNDAD